MKSSNLILVRFIFFILIGSICFYQSFDIIHTYFQYPTLTKVREYRPTLIESLPGITLCNNNRVSLRSMMQSNQVLRRVILAKHPHLFQHNYDDYENVTHRSHLKTLAKFDSFRDDLYKIYQRLNISTQAIIDRTNLNQRFTILPQTKHFIKRLMCPAYDNRKLDCNQLTQIESIQDRFCISLMHAGTMHYDAHNRPHVYDSQIYPKEYMDRREVLRMHVDFEPEDYGDLKRQIGARITFHGNQYIASASDKDFYIQPGYRYEFKIVRQDSTEASKTSECADYEAKNLDSYRNQTNPRIPLSSRTCIQNCIIQNILALLKCWPPTISYFRNDTFDPNLDIRFCKWYREPQYFKMHRDMRLARLIAKQKIEGNSLQLEEQIREMKFLFRLDMGIYVETERFCASECVKSCTGTNLRVSLSRMANPEKLQLMVDKSGQGAIINRCCSIISIKYPNLQYQIYESEMRYTAADTIGNLGGILAFWLGFSMLSIYRAIRKLSEIVHERLDKEHNHRIHPSHSFVAGLNII